MGREFHTGILPGWLWGWSGVGRMCSTQSTAPPSACSQLTHPASLGTFQRLLCPGQPRNRCCTLALLLSPCPETMLGENSSQVLLESRCCCSLQFKNIS